MVNATMVAVLVQQNELMSLRMGTSAFSTSRLASPLTTSSMSFSS